MASAQFAPQAGIAGSTAIHASSTSIAGWATSAVVTRGYLDIANKPLGYTTTGTDVFATGAADGSIVSLGDSGVAVLKFAGVLYDGPGPDLAVFENGFVDPSDPNLAFLELAFVEVSSDGSNFVRFPACSYVPQVPQIPGSGVYTDARLINNLAGKYTSMNGTPFDLSELSGESGLDISHITHVRLVDVTGSVAGGYSHDTGGRVINDPYPTNFPTGGFDLDAVAAINIHSTGVNLSGHTSPINIYPNPATDQLTISLSNEIAALDASLTSITGTVILHTPLTKTTTLPLHSLPTGVYYLTITDTNGHKWVERVVKY